MSEKRIYPVKGLKNKGKGYHGNATFLASGPDAVAKELKSFRMEFSFSESLKLYVALQSCVQALNSYNRKAEPGRSMGLELSIKGSSMEVIEKRVKAK
jgi:hypothetical protein